MIESNRDGAVGANGVDIAHSLSPIMMYDLYQLSIPIEDKAECRYHMEIHKVHLIVQR